MKVAVITGSRRGIGKGIAIELGKEGYTVVLSGTSEDANIVKEFEAMGINAHYIKCDVTQKNERENLIDRVYEKFGEINLFVNNAGVAPNERKDILETTEESYNRVVDTNSKSCFFMCQYLAKKMTEQQGEKRIINISSISAYTSSYERGEYCISKASIGMITKLFAHRLAEYNIPVFEVRPGVIQTDMTDKVLEKYKKLINDGLTPIKRLGQPEDIGKCVVALGSGKMDFATGQVINADGGFHIRRL
ncbi:MAG: 3-ketoacyl-ACP reductase [Lachnospirales bacterium]